MKRKLAAWWKARTKWQKIGVAAGGVVVGVPLLVICWMYLAYPDSRAADPALDVDRGPASIHRGEYLFFAVADCAGCHSRRDFERVGGPMVGDIGGGSGGREPGAKPYPFADMPGEIYGRNITANRDTGVGAWTDDEIIRAIREGVSRDGSPLFPMMPYPEYRAMSDTDVQAIVAFIRNMPGVTRAVPRSNIDFPLNFVMRTIPEPLTEAVPDINRQDHVKYGEYLAKMAGCVECHTQRIDGERQENMLLAGGRSFGLEGKSFELVSSNLTPDPQTGLRATEDEFVARFKSFEAMAKGDEEVPRVTRANAVAMPWLAFAAINDSDLRAIYAYLRSVRPVRNAVVTRPR
jgi:mono/diheme cytochrome c family protein